jgi:predicted acetyltransferase
MLNLKMIKGSKNLKIPGKMARVVDVKKVLKKMTYDSNIKIDYKIKVEDPWAEWNNNVFSVAIANGKTKVDAGAKRADIVCDIGTFSQISLGFISLEEARPMGKITINDLNKFKAIKKLFKSKNTFIIDNF